jgi:hypothetical protein
MGKLSMLVCTLVVTSVEAQPQTGVPRLTAHPPDSTRMINYPYSLFRPVPRTRLRELATDRPDVTESAYSVDAGHFQMETDLVRVGRQSDGGSRQREIDVNAINLKIGLTRTMDLELIVNSYSIQTEGNTTHAGFGDLTLRLKRNLWGNDGGRTALSVIPFVKIPTGRAVGNRAWEGGLVAPFAWQLPHDWTLGSQLQATLNYDSQRPVYYLNLAPTLTVGHDLYRQVGAFIEVAGYWDVRQPDWRLTLNGGPIVHIGPNVQLDVGVNLALTPYTPTSYFIGLSIRR